MSLDKKNAKPISEYPPDKKEIHLVDGIGWTSNDGESEIEAWRDTDQGDLYFSFYRLQSDGSTSVLKARFKLENAVVIAVMIEQLVEKSLQHSDDKEVADHPPSFQETVEAEDEN